MCLFKACLTRKSFHVLNEFNEGLTGEQMFNYHESGLNYKMLPRKFLAARTKAAATGYAINMVKKV